MSHHISPQSSRHYVTPAGAVARYPVYRLEWSANEHALTLEMLDIIRERRLHHVWRCISLPYYRGDRRAQREELAVELLASRVGFREHFAAAPEIYRQHYGAILYNKIWDLERKCTGGRLEPPRLARAVQESLNFALADIRPTVQADQGPVQPGVTDQGPVQPGVTDQGPVQPGVTDHGTAEQLGGPEEIQPAHQNSLPHDGQDQTEEPERVAAAECGLEPNDDRVLDLDLTLTSLSIDDEGAQVKATSDRDGNTGNAVERGALHAQDSDNSHSEVDHHGRTVGGPRTTGRAGLDSDRPRVTGEQSSPRVTAVHQVSGQDLRGGDVSKGTADRQEMVSVFSRERSVAEVDNHEAGVSERESSSDSARQINQDRHTVDEAVVRERVSTSHNSHHEVIGAAETHLQGDVDHGSAQHDPRQVTDNTPANGDPGDHGDAMDVEPGKGPSLGSKRRRSESYSEAEAQGETKGTASKRAKLQPEPAEGQTEGPGVQVQRPKKQARRRRG